MQRGGFANGEYLGVSQPQPGPAGALSRIAVDLYWLPLGAGGRSVRLNGRIYEAVAARVQRRPTVDLYHSALVVCVPDGRFVVEQAPVRDNGGPTRGVVVEGAVGCRRAGRFRIFRYEVRQWLNGVIPDIGEAVDSPQHLTRDPLVARRILDEHLVPAFTSGDYAGGLDGTLAAVFGAVQDAYRQDRMPDNFTMLWRQVSVASPIVAQRALPVLAGLGFLPRFGISLFAGVFGTIAYYVLRQVSRTLYYMGQVARNIVAPRPDGTKPKDPGAGSIPFLEQLKLVGFSLEVFVIGTGLTLFAIAGLAGVVIVAAGGAFSGAGALVRW